MSSFIRRTFTTPDAQDADLILSTGGSRLQSFLMISNQDKEDSEVSWVEMIFTHDGVLYKTQGNSLEEAAADFLTKSGNIELAETLMQAVLVDINKAIQDAK